MTDVAFKRWVAFLALVRIVPALIVLAAGGRSLPLLPGYAYGPPNGDTYGFYAAAREFISAWGHVPRAVLGIAALLVLAGAAASYVAWRRGRTTEAVVAVAILLGAFTCLSIHEMGPTGAGAVGWPIVWAIPLFPLRVVGALSYHLAFYLGIAILLAANVATVVATALVSRDFVRGRLALLAPALLVVWPFLMRALEGTGNGVYGSWLNDSGLALYSEPLSTALVICAIALVVLRTSPTACALAGALMGLTTAVRVSNGTIAVVLFAALLIARAWRSAGAFAVAGLGTVSIAIVFWSRGYSSFKNRPSKAAPDGLFSWHYLVRSWRDSTVFDWKMLMLLLPLPLIGLFALRRRPRDLIVLGGTVAVTAAFYSAYYITALHPRFLYVALPALFLLAGIGVDQLMTIIRGRAPAEA